ncbi:hypothetical protein AB0I77_07790 [Streptomyces sp. NPDC050619]|uniref:hypothetical protein n=1 Tax=Streptomyces sp. NPDC050619 TaxID=3157214 RepID=UPI00344A2F38
MVDHRHETPGENGDPVPRDLPDQQVSPGEDPWEVAPAEAEGGVAEESDETAAEVPDTDEAGTGRQGAPQSGTVHPEHPVPDESSA